MTIESIMNFEVGQRVKFNESNHGFINIGAYDKIRNKEGRVVKIPLVGYINENGHPSQKRSGRICVMWDGDKTCRICNYKNLKII